MSSFKSRLQAAIDSAFEPRENSKDFTVNSYKKKNSNINSFEYSDINYMQLKQNRKNMFKSKVDNFSMFANSPYEEINPNL